MNDRRPTLAGTMSEALRQGGLEVDLSGSTSLDEVDEVLHKLAVRPERVLSHAALVALRKAAGFPRRPTRAALGFIVREARTPSLVFARDGKTEWLLSPWAVCSAMQNANRALELINDLSTAYEAPVFELLGLRNLSSFVGEVFALQFCELEAKRLFRNPNQDGYPDLLALTASGRKYIYARRRKNQMHDKSFWSPFPFGGLEVKATCGNTPSATVAVKPRIGEARIRQLTSAEWKAHHRATNNLIGLYWDFVDGLPTIVASFFRNDLTRDDWGRVVRPASGSRTTSVSIMNRKGVKKMGEGWIVLPQEDVYLDALCAKRVFRIDKTSLRQAAIVPAERAAGASSLQG